MKVLLKLHKEENAGLFRKLQKIPEIKAIIDRATTEELQTILDIPVDNTLLPKYVDFVKKLSEQAYERDDFALADKLLKYTAQPAFYYIRNRFAPVMDQLHILQEVADIKQSSELYLHDKFNALAAKGIKG